MLRSPVRLPLLYYTNNVGGTATLLEAMLSARCQNIVFSSSCATYGIPQSNPIPESHRKRPYIRTAHQSTFASK